MRTFEIFLNGRKLCDAGVGDSGVLTAIVTWRFRQGEKVKGSRRTQNDLRLDVAGLNELTAEDIRWGNRPLRIGDEVRIRIGETERVTRPASRKRSDPALVEKAEKKYLENAAKRHGWKILKPSQPRTKKLASRPA
jgi:hypothetical protein